MSEPKNNKTLKEGSTSVGKTIVRQKIFCRFLPKSVVGPEKLNKKGFTKNHKITTFVVLYVTGPNGGSYWVQVHTRP